MRNLLLAFFLLICSAMQTQELLQGQVIDIETTVPISFAKISYNNKTILSDWEGKFTLEIFHNKKPIIVTYKGYYDKKHYLSPDENFLLIKMATNYSVKDELLSEDKSNAIIRKLVENRQKNQPEKAFKSFQYKNYESVLVSANPDSISSKIDTILKRNLLGQRRIKIDSSNYKFKKILKKQHVYQTEKVNQIQFDGKTTKETVIASRMAGFKKPIYEYLGLNLVSYSLYENQIEILENAMKNPLSNSGRKLYYYRIVDTVMVDKRQVYCVYFQPKKLTANRLRGLVYVDAENYGIAKAFFRIYGVVNINAAFSYTYLKDQKIWFPKKRSFNVVKGNNTRDLNILGGTIKFNSSLEGINQDASDRVFMKLESTPYDIEINKNTIIKHPQIKIDVPESGMSKPKEFWKTFQKDTLDIRRIQTYTSLDSLSEVEKIEHRLLLGRKIINGYFPINVVDIDLRSIIKYNNYEGFRLGIGGVTNTKLSDKYKIGGFVGYGFKDDKFKYNITPSYMIDKETNTWVSTSYSDELKEIGQIDFATESKRFKIYDPRPINISTFYNHKTFSTFIESKYFAKTETYFSFSRSEIQPLFDYTFKLNDNFYTNYNLTTFQFSLQYNPFSTYMQTPTGRLEIEKKYPKLSLQYTKSISSLLGSDFDFSKIDFRVAHEIPHLTGHTTSFILQGGFAFGEVPLTNLYSVAPNNLNRDSLLKRITFAGKNSFETMFFNEFFSSRYSSFQVRHTFNKISLANRINPLISVVTRMAIGSLEYPERHIGFAYKTLEKGYIESGVEANSIYKGLGLTFFFRYGPNGLPKLEDNLALKISYTLNLGF
jgi:hypothetical protein